MAIPNITDGLRGIILRELVQSPFVTKNSELTWDELDTNIATLATYLLAIETSSNIRTYQVGEIYEPGEFVRYGSKLWKQVYSEGSVQGVTPGTDATKWQQATAADFVHERNRDTQLITEDGTPVTADSLKSMVETGTGEPYIEKTYSELYALMTSSPPLLLEGYGYKITAPTEDWDNELVYEEGDEVVGDDGYFYKSLQDGNQNEDPQTATAWWVRVYRNIFLRALSSSQLSVHGAIIESDYGSPATDVVDFVLYDVLTDTVYAKKEEVVNLPPAYGELYETGGSSNIAIVGAGTYSKWVNVTVGEESLTEGSTSEDTITISTGGGGTYKVDLQVSFSGDANSTVTVKVFLNDSATRVGLVHKINSSGNTNAVGASGLLVLSDSDVLDVRFTADSTALVSPKEVNFNIVRIAQ